jgi:pimeloyl-ACP methyl ester carboxylesterase
MLRRIVLALSLAVSLLPAAAAEREVSANGLPATLLVPDTGEPAAFALFIAGSGPTDRNGNSRLGINAGYLGKLAAALADAGFASLRYDKRGIPGSLPVPDESALTFQTFVDDAGRALDWLRGEAAGRPLVLIGHSEGGLIALELAASRPELARIVLLATPGRPAAETLRDQLGRLDEPLRGQALAILGRVAVGEEVADVPPALLALFRPSVQPFLHGLFALDPAGRLKAFGRPALVVGGGRDLQVVRADFDALAAAGPNVEPLWIETMNHVLASVPDADPRANLATYSDPAARLAPGLAEAIAAFLKDGAR